MRKGRALLTLAAFGSVLVVALVTSTAATAANTLTVIEHAVSDHLTDVGRSGLGPGDLLTFRNPIYDSTNATQVGTDQGSCIRITRFRDNQKGSWECEWTTFLNGGADSITVESPYYDTGLGTGAITGGTGAYLGASGSLDLSCTQTECTFEFNIS
jgi:allene oxide cyclase